MDGGLSFSGQTRGASSPGRPFCLVKSRPPCRPGRPLPAPQPRGASPRLLVPPARGGGGSPMCRPPSPCVAAPPCGFNLQFLSGRMSSVFSRAYLPSVGPVWWRVQSSLPACNRAVYSLLLGFKRFFGGVRFGCQSFIECVLSRDFLPGEARLVFLLLPPCPRPPGDRPPRSPTAQPPLFTRTDTRTDTPRHRHHTRTRRKAEKEARRHSERIVGCGSPVPRVLQTSDSAARSQVCGTEAG